MTGAPHPRPLALVNARLVDPESEYDGPGSVVVQGGVIADVLQSPRIDAPSSDLEIVDCAGARWHESRRPDQADMGAQQLQQEHVGARHAAVQHVPADGDD